MKESKRHRSLSGAVLIMILTVMFILIILLTATLTTVTTANQRIYTKFEENQAYYTARSALDVFTQNLLDDGDYWSAKTYNYTDKEASPMEVKTGEKMKQGLALQYDLYKIHSQCETYGKDGSGVAVLKWAENMDTTNATAIFSVANIDSSGGLVGTPPEKDNFSISDDQLNGDANVNKQKDYIEYQVTLPTLSDGSSSYGKFVDVDKAKTGQPQMAKIKVEVLDRVYATDPKYSAKQINDYFGGDHSVIPDDATLMAAIAKGSRTEDYMKIKITSTVTVFGTEGVAVVIIETEKVDTPDTSNAINSMGGLTGSGAGLVAAGGASSLNTGNTTIDASGTAGSIFAMGSLDWNSSGGSAFDDGASVYARGGLKFTNAQNITAVGQDSFMYTEGVFDITSSFNYGSASNPMSVICDEFKYDNGITINGNIYANKLNVGGNNGNQQIGGNATLYAKDLYVSTGGGGVTVDTDHNMITINSVGSNNVNVYGDIYIDNMKMTDLYPGFTVTNYNIAFKTGSDFNLFDKTPVTNDGKTKLEVKLPGKLPSGSKDTITLETAQSRYASYFEEDAFDENGELIDNTGSGDPYNQNNIKANILTAEKTYYKSNNLAVPDTPTLNILTTTISGSNISSSNSGILTSGGNYVVDTSGGTVTIQLQPGTWYSGEIKVTGDGALNVLMPELASPQDYNFNNFSIYTDNIDKTSGQKIKNGTTKAAKINYYVGNNANISMSNNNFFAGYFYMPLSKMTNSSGNNGVSKEYTYNGTVTTKNYFIVGSVTCGDYDTGGSNSGVCYVDPNSGAETPGEPILTVQSSQYVRN